QQNMADQGLVVRMKDYGPEHAEVLKLKGQIQEIKEKINKRVEGILVGLEAKVASVGEGLTNLQKEVESANSNDIQKAKLFRPYFDKKREFEELQRFRQVLTLKIASEQIDQGLPKSSLVV